MTGLVISPDSASEWFKDLGRKLVNPSDFTAQVTHQILSGISSPPDSEIWIEMMGWAIGGGCEGLFKCLEYSCSGKRGKVITKIGAKCVSEALKGQI